MNGLTSSLNGKLALRQPPRFRTRLAAETLLKAGSPRAEDVLRILMTDPLAAISTLKRANESFYGMRGSVGSLTHAVEILGASSTPQLLTTIPASDDATQEGPAQRALIRHATVTAHVAHRLANGRWLDDEGSPFEPGLVATTGLLHNVGRIAFCISLPLESDSLYGFGTTPFPIDGPLTELEQLQFGLNHAELGAFMLHHLQFPEEMVESIQRHRCGPPSDPPSHRSRLAWITGAACLVAESAGYGLDAQVSFYHRDLDQTFEDYDREASLQPGDLDRVRAELHDRGPRILGDTTPERPDRTMPSDRTAVPHAATSRFAGSPAHNIH
jgi:HD-like signal output (HDOD) protein